jgi:SAM-dependent methyltransferase
MRPLVRNEHLWQPTKVDLTPNGPRAGGRVGVGSWHAVNQTAPLVASALRRYARGHLLDLGAGRAPYFATYRPLVDEITCIDWEGSLHDSTHLDVSHDLNQGIPFPDDTFDTVLSTSVFEHIRQPDVLWGHVTRVLAPGGHLVLNVPFLYWLHEQPYDYFRYTEYALRDYCTVHDLTVLELEATGGALDVMLDLSSKLVAQQSQRLARMLVRLGEPVVARLASRGQPHLFPFGYVLVARG